MSRQVIKEATITHPELFWCCWITWTEWVSAGFHTSHRFSLMQQMNMDECCASAAWSGTRSVTSAVIKAFAGNLTFVVLLQRATKPQVNHRHAHCRPSGVTAKLTAAETCMCHWWPLLLHVQRILCDATSGLYRPPPPTVVARPTSWVRCTAGRREGEEEAECLLLSYISLKSVPDRLAAHSDTSCKGRTSRTTQRITGKCAKSRENSFHMLISASH